MNIGGNFSGIKGTTKKEQINVGISRLAVAKGEIVLAACSLGSCLGLCLYDKTARVGGLAHCLLPARPALYRSQAEEGWEPAKYVRQALDELVRLMEAQGAARGRLIAKLFGGAQMFTFGSPVGKEGMGVEQIGRLNGESAYKCLQERGIPVAASDLGGNSARSIYFHLDSGRVEVKTISLRNGTVLSEK